MAIRCSYCSKFVSVDPCSLYDADLDIGIDNDGNVFAVVTGELQCAECGNPILEAEVEEKQTIDFTHDSGCDDPDLDVIDGKIESVDEGKTPITKNKMYIVWVMATIECASCGAKKTVGLDVKMPLSEFGEY